jgi:hypothetical protein
MPDYDIDLMETMPTPDEARLGVLHVEVLHWGRTTLVKFIGGNGFETLGTYTAGPRNNVIDARIAIARANATQRLCRWLDRQQDRAPA